MRKLKIWFTDFWPGLERDNFLLKLIENNYDVILNPNPDYLFYSVYGNEHFKYTDCIKIFFTGENIFPDFNFCDYAIGFHHFKLYDRYLRFPLYLIYPNFETLKLKVLQDENQLLQRKFCNFIYSNSLYADPKRELFFNELSKYKKIDSGGRHLNNIGFRVKNKIEFIKDYKFTIAFENSSVDGYTTEKIMEPMTVNSLPIYWGNRIVDKDFDSSSFINVMGYNSFDEAIEEIIRLDNDDEAYLNKLNIPWMNNQQTNVKWNELLLNFLSGIFTQPLNMVKRRCQFGQVKFDLEQRMVQSQLYKNKQKINNIKNKIYKKLGL